MPYKLLNLQLFGEEGMADGGMSTGEIANPTAENPIGEGVATGTEGEQIAPAEDNIPTWDELINGKYKKEYSDSVKNAVNKRFKNQRDLQGQIDRIDPMIKALAERYGVSPNPDGSISIDDLQRKVFDDNSMYEKEAFQRGMSVDDLKQLKQLERENQQLRMANTRSQEQMEWDAIVQDSENLKQVYPDFDLDAEMSNRQFGTLFATLRKSGFPDALKTAYETVHKDEIMGGAMQYAVQKTQEKISNSIQSGMRRPQENGTNGQSAGQVPKFDPSKLTKAQIADFRRRAERGERITF